MRVITLIKAGPDRLTPQEAQMIFDCVFQSHDHDAAQPAEPLFWHRSQADEIWHWMN